MKFFKQYPEVIPLVLLVLLLAGLQPRIARRMQERMFVFDSFDHGIRVERLVLR